MLCASSTSFPYRLAGHVSPTPLLMRMAMVIHILALAGKAVGVSIAFLLAKIAILSSSKGAWAGVRMTARCDGLALADTRSIAM